jgi:16S rRNA (adenine1518-N6/adenine1519-N6)-dimethyltransferase
MKGGPTRRAAAVLPAGVVPRQEYGQSFLMTREILERSCDYADLGREDTVLEIGAGIGNLTELLAQRAGRVFAIEIDRQFAPILARLRARFGNLDVLCGNALELSFPAFDKAVANLPYKAALPLILKLLDHDFAVAVLVVQQRLARRLAARPGQEGYSRISVTVQRLARLRLLETIKPHHFSPPPTVDSAMLKISKSRPRFAIPSEDEFRLLLDFLFVRREWPAGEALRRLGRQAEVRRIAAGLPAALARRKVCQVSPEEFGLIASRVHQAGLAIPAVPDELKRKAQKHF